MRTIALFMLLSCSGCTSYRYFYYQNKVVINQGFYKGQTGTVMKESMSEYQVKFDDGTTEWFPPEELSDKNAEKE